MFLFNGAPLGTEEKIAKVAVKPRKPQGYESLFAKYKYSNKHGSNKLSAYFLDSKFILFLKTILKSG